MCPGFDFQTRRHLWVEFVVGSLLCSERFFSGYSGFPLSSNTNISKFQFDLDYCQVLYRKPLARVIAQAIPVFDIKFTFTFQKLILQLITLLYYTCTFINIHKTTQSRFTAVHLVIVRNTIHLTKFQLLTFFFANS